MRIIMVRETAGMKSSALRRQMPKLVKVVVKPNRNRWSITAIDKKQPASRASGANVTSFDGIRRDEFDKLIDKAKKKHAWLLNELAKR